MDRKTLVNQSIDYIFKHLDENLSLDTLAAHFFISKYHFSRIFKEETGESVYAFIKRCKVDQSAVDLKLNPAKTITDIGLDYGYSASNYSSVFKMRHAASPARFRNALSTHSMPVPFTPQRIVHFKTADKYAAQMNIITLDDMFVLYERFIGSYVNLEQNWYQFLDKHHALLNEKTLLVERFFNDPAVTDTAQCICDIGMTVESDCPLENVAYIEGGPWLVYRFIGAITDIFADLEGIFSVWLPQSGYKMTRRYGLNIYRRIDRENHSVVMDLCIPLS